MLWQIVLSKNSHLVISTPTCSLRILLLTPRRWRPLLLEPTWACDWFNWWSTVKTRLSDSQGWVIKKAKFLLFPGYSSFLSHMTFTLGNQPPCCEEAQTISESMCRCFSQHLQLRSQPAASINRQACEGQTIRGFQP